MVIFYDNQIFSLQRYGGISRYFFELAKAINVQHIHRAYILGGINDNEYLATDGGSFIKGYRYKEHISKLIKNRFYDFAGLMQEVVMKASIITLPPPDIIHETYYKEAASFKYRVPVIITVHDLIYEKYPGQFSDGKEVISAKSSAIKRANHIIAVSNNTKKDLMEIYDISPDKISVVYHGISALSNTESRKIIEAPYILYVGRREGYKNFKTLLDVFINHEELHKEFNLVCFGGGPFTSIEMEIIRKNNLSEKMIYVKGNDSVLASLYSNARVFVYPSLYEGFGMSPLEAMQLKCPVISANTSSLPEAVGNAAYLFDPKSEKELFTALSEMLNNGKLRLEFIKKGEEHAKQFSWEKTAEKTIEVYKKTIS